jgi:hypothetical protein
MRPGATVAFSAVLAALGLLLVVETALVGGGVGYLLGVLFVLAGALRAYMTRLGRGR